MNTRLEQIRARLDAVMEGKFDTRPEFFNHAPADIAWLLERLEAQKAMADEYRFELDRLRVRIAQGYNDRA